MTRGDYPSRRRRSSQRRTRKPTGIEGDAHTPRMACGRHDASSHRMERPWSWLFFIDAEHIAAEKMVFDLASASSRCRCTVPSFPDFGNSLATFGSSFTQSDYSAHAAIAFPRSKGVSRASYSRTTRPAEGGPAFPVGFGRSRKAGRKTKHQPEHRSGFGKNNLKFL